MGLSELDELVTPIRAEIVEGLCGKALTRGIQMAATFAARNKGHPLVSGGVVAISTACGGAKELRALGRWVPRRGFDIR